MPPDDLLLAADLEWKPAWFSGVNLQHSSTQTTISLGSCLILDPLLQHAHLVLQMAYHISQVVYTQAALLTCLADDSI